LFQLPPTFKKDLSRLQNFVGRLPRHWPAALEFRHSSWFEDDVYETLRARDIALVAVDEDESEGPGSPLVPTASWGYLRMRRTSYSTSTLGQWGERIRSQPWTEAYVFLKHEEGSPTGPAAAQELKQLLGNPA
jgi:uncharacterized protein YecE (DUF72 family)